MLKEIKIEGSSTEAYSSDSSKFYRNYWADGKIISRTTHAKNQFILDYFFKNRLKELCILEIGVGGEGGIIYNLKDDNDVHGIDISFSAKRNCENLGLPITIHDLDKNPLPFNCNFFDIVFAFEVFEHFSAPQFVIEEIWRVLKKAGMLLLSTPNPVVHHWPRFFYPELFEEKAFKDFLMINMLELIEKTSLGKNVYWQRLSDESMAAWSWIWLCKKIDDNKSQTLFEYGKHFWSQKNKAGIRIKPIEAMDLFRRSYQTDNQMLEAKFYLARALVYRLIYGEKKEFIETLNFVVDCARCDQYPVNMNALYHFALIYIELKKFGIELITADQFNEAVTCLNKFPHSSSLIETIHVKRKKLDII